jgi:hypothetical protein
VLDKTGIQGKRLSSIISFGNDGIPYNNLEETFGIECAFAWRTLHSLFKAHHDFYHWLSYDTPANKRDLKLKDVLAVIEYHFAKNDDRELLLFIGIDEYQMIGQENLDVLFAVLCNSSYRPQESRLSLFCMFAGTDMEMARVARTACPNTERIPISFLNHTQAVKAIAPYISKYHDGFVVNEAFEQNVFYLGGVPRLLTEFAKKNFKSTKGRYDDG